MTEVIFEMRNGVLLDVYCNDPNTRIVVAWDRTEDPAPEPAFRVPANQPGCMPEAALQSADVPMLRRVAEASKVNPWPILVPITYRSPAARRGSGVSPGSLAAKGLSAASSIATRTARRAAPSTVWPLRRSTMS